MSIREEKLPICHLALRIPARVRIQGRSVDILEAHNAAVRLHGKTIFAKYGPLVSEKKLHRLRCQITEGIPTYLIVAIREGSQFLAYNSPVHAIYTSKLDSTQRAIAPTYYSLLDAFGNCRFELHRVFSPTVLGDLVLASNDKPLLEILDSCRTSAMLVHHRF